MKAFSTNATTKEVKELDIQMQANSVYTFFSSILIDELGTINKHMIYVDANALCEGKTPMKCQKCDRPASFHITDLVDGKPKELHLCHVFAISSDSLFIERVYSEAMLHGRCEYVLVDDFDYETTVEFLRKYGFAEDEINLVWGYFGGKPVYLIRAVRAEKTGENIHEVVDTFFNMRLSQIKDAIYELEETNNKLFERVVELFRKFKDKEVIRYKRLGREIKFCVEKNIMFVEPIRRTIKPQSRLDLLAMREIVKG
jgi:AAA+ ATPase superfamily predicted ATPase